MMLRSRVRGPGLWSRLTPLQRAGVILAPMALLCCGGVTVIGAVAGADDPVQQVAPAAGEQLAEAAPDATFPDMASFASAAAP